MRNTFLGFDGFSDFFGTLFGDFNKLVKVNMVIVLVLTTFMTNYIYEDAVAVYTLWALYVFDFITAIALAISRGNVISRRMPRVALNLVAATTLLSLSWWMSKSMVLFIPLPGTILGILFSTQLISIIENLVELEVLPKHILKVVNKSFRIGRISKQQKESDKDQ